MVSIATHKDLIGLHHIRSARQVAERLGHYFDLHPQISREDFLLAAIDK
jgi:hypothetical protein